MLNTNHLSFIYSFLLSLAFLLLMHCARHTFACMAVEYGMPIDVLAKILGHSNTNMTRHYAKFSETVIGREMEAFGEKLASAAAEGDSGL
ncbi:MAG: tyrosine-type recombinase/integrase [Lachnospiraceae bacterium]|nr:tyrosine-type recombinase/integrase [Lachnospiraceae bacterium]